MKRTYLVVYEKGKRNYSGFAPDVPGCGSTGKSIEEMRINLREALELYMKTSLSFGDALPESVTTSITLPLEGELDPNTAYVVEHLAVTLPELKLSRTKSPATRTRASTPKKHRVMQAA